MFQKQLVALMAALCAALVFSPAIIAEEAEKAVVTDEAKAQQLSDQEFQLNRQAMIDDTARKVEVLKNAHDCAVAAKTQEQFSECKVKLREAILSHMKK